MIPSSKSAVMNAKNDNELTGDSVGVAVGLVVGNEVGALLYTERRVTNK